MAKKKEILTFGDRLRKLRKDSGLSQADLARILGYQKNGPVSDLELDKTPATSVVLFKLARTLKIDLHWLITGQPSPYVKTLISGYTEIITNLSGLIKNALDDLIQQKIVCYEKRYFLAKEVNKDPKKQTDLDKLNVRIGALEAAYDSAAKAYEQLLNPTFIPPPGEPPDTP